jgi:hypothetical protein
VGYPPTKKPPMLDNRHFREVEKEKKTTKIAEK